MSVDERDTEVPGEPVERAAAQLRQEPARQSQRTEALLREDFAAQLEPRRIEEGEVECGIVRDQHAAGGKGSKARQHAVDARAAGDHGIGDAGELGDEARQPPARIDQLLEAIDHAPGVQAQRADLDDPVAERGRAAGGPRSTSTNAVSSSGRASSACAVATHRPVAPSNAKRASVPSSARMKRGPSSGSVPGRVKTNSSSSRGVAPAGRSSR